jgi:hypothetical protein
MITNQDTLDVTRAVLLASYLEALKAGEDEKRKIALEEIKKLNQQKMAKLIRQATS